MDKQVIEKLAKDLKKGDEIIAVWGNDGLATWSLKDKKITAVHERHDGKLIEIVIGGQRHWFAYNSVFKIAGNSKPKPKKPIRTNAVNKLAKWLGVEVKT